jgi:hypothetical protein
VARSNLYADKHINIANVDHVFVKIRGYEALLTSANMVIKELEEACRESMLAVVTEYYRRLYKNCSGDMTYDTMKKMDHPYAKRKGGIGTAESFEINVHEGHVRDAISYEVELVEGRGIVGRIGWKNPDFGLKNIVIWLLFGTKYMIPRDILELTWCADLFVEKIRKQLIMRIRRGIVPEKNMRIRGV